MGLPRKMMERLSMIRKGNTVEFKKPLNIPPILTQRAPLRGFMQRFLKADCGN
jgi:hypothetical protein